MPAFANQPGHGGKRHLTAQGQDQRLEQEREAGKLSRPAGLDQNHPAIRELDPGGAHFEIAFVLEEIEMPVALGLGVVNRMQPFQARVRKAAAASEDRCSPQPPSRI